MLSRRRILWVLTLMLPACGGTVTTAAQDASVENTIDSAPDASGGARAPGCPATLPEAGALCTLQRPPQIGSPWPCEYGSDPHCTTIASCIQSGSSIYGNWQITPPNALCNGNPPGCPSAFDLDAGANGPTACPTPDSCWYPEGSCACVPCEVGSAMTVCGARNVCGMDASDDAGDAGTTWHCEAWPAPDGCPEPRPLLGTPCSVSDPNLTCAYGPPCCGLVPNPQPVMQCFGGFWDTWAGGC